ncbi:MAG: acyl carrier protein [Chloroflexi bacterium]|nr:acyl carrier protein [Chloroflexota bacterium]
MPTHTELALQILVAQKLKIAPARVPLDQSLLDDLGLDSFDVMNVILELEQAFPPVSLSDEAAQELKTLRELAAYIDRARSGDVG